MTPLMKRNIQRSAIQGKRFETDIPMDHIPKLKSQSLTNSAKIEERGLQLLNFMEKRWDIKFKDEEDKKTLLFLDTKDESADD